MESASDLGIEILVRLATAGELDPWDVDIIEATDRCLASLDATDRNDLRLCGRALHCATILLRLKAEAMAAEIAEALAPPPSMDDDWVDFDMPEDGDAEFRPNVHILDLALIRRVGAKQPRRRRVTLSELIRELQRMEAETKLALPKGNFIRRTTAAELRAKTVGLAHEEDIEGDAKRLAEDLLKRFRTEPSVTFGRLATDYKDDRGLFLALMFLAHWGVIEVHQDSFYAEITVGAIQDVAQLNQEAAA